MTREEAIKALRDVQREVMRDSYIDKVYEMAIEALSSPESSDDTISRRAAINEAYEICLDGDVYQVVQVETLIGLPSAEKRTEKRTETHACDSISRQAAIDELDKEYRCTDQSDDWDGLKTAMLIIENLPSAQPEIIRCRNCKFASGDSRICMKFGHSPIGELDFCAWAERRTDEE